MTSSLNPQPVGNYFSLPVRSPRFPRINAECLDASGTRFSTPLRALEDQTRTSSPLRELDAADAFSITNVGFQPAAGSISLANCCSSGLRDLRSLEASFQATYRASVATGTASATRKRVPRSWVARFPQLAAKAPVPGWKLFRSGPEMRIRSWVARFPQSAGKFSAVDWKRSGGKPCSLRGLTVPIGF